MSRYVLNRLALTVPVLLGVSVLVFSMLHLCAGDPIMAMFAETGATGRQVEEVREQLGLNDPLVVQYFRFLGKALRGDLGRSLWGEREVAYDPGRAAGDVEADSGGDGRCHRSRTGIWASWRRSITTDGWTMLRWSLPWPGCRCPVSGWGCC